MTTPETANTDTDTAIITRESANLGISLAATLETVWDHSTGRSALVLVPKRPAACDLTICGVMEYLHRHHGDYGIPLLWVDGRRVAFSDVILGQLHMWHEMPEWTDHIEVQLQGELTGSDLEAVFVDQAARRRRFSVD